jgi:hypothetical protein
MKTRIVLAGLLAMVMALEVTAQRAENDDMYFRGKDRERNKSIEAEASYSAAKTKKQNREEEAVVDEEEDEDSNPTDSYSARNVNPEYVSRSNSEKASEDESNYYLEGYTPPAAATNINNSYYNNANWARSSYYANAMWNSPYYGMGFYNPWMSPYGGGFYDPWMMTSPYGMGPSYGWRNGWSVSLTYGNSWSPWGFGGNPYFGGYGYPAYYGGGYYHEPVRGNYGKRPSRHSAAVQPTQRTVTRSRSNNDVADVNGRTRTRQTQDDYYVRPSRRNSGFNPAVNPSGNRPFDNGNSGLSNPSSRPSRSRDLFSQPSTPSRSTPSYTPSPSRSGSGGGSGGGGGGGGSSPRPRGRG